MKIVALMRIRRGRRRVSGWRNRICVADTRRLKEGAAEMRFVGEDEDTMMILLLLLHGIHNSSNRAQRGPVVGLSGAKIKLMAQHLLYSRRRSGSTAAVAATTTRTVDSWRGMKQGKDITVCVGVGQNNIQKGRIHQQFRMVHPYLRQNTGRI